MSTRDSPYAHAFPYASIPPVEIPASHPLEVYGVRAIPPSGETPHALVESSLASPIGMPRLSRLVTPRSRVLVIIDDASRPTPVGQILPPLLAELALGGVPDGNIRFLVALGTHRHMTREEITSRVGREVAARFPVANHEWADPGSLHEYGVLDGRRVLLNKAMNEADIVVGVGSIAPHPAAGFSGGGKIIAPGVATEEAVGEFHWQSVHHPQKAVLGVRDNPMREQIDRIARLGRLTAIVNVVLDGQGRIVRSFSGDPVEAHRAGCALSGEFYRVPVSRPESAGIFIIDTHPLDQDLWQGVKAMCALECIVPDGAAVILATPAPEGVSRQHPGVLEHGYMGLGAATRLVRDGRIDKVTAHNIVQGGRLVERTAAFLVSPGIPSEHARQLGFTPFETVQGAFAEAARRKGATARVVILKMGGEICPVPV
jgi:nickel-dependent lactate racemase